MIFNSSSNTWDKQHNGKAATQNWNTSCGSIFLSHTSTYHPRGFIMEISLQKTPSSLTILHRYNAYTLLKYCNAIYLSSIETLPLLHCTPLQGHLFPKTGKFPIFVLRVNLWKGKINGYKYSLSLLKHSKHNQESCSFQHLLSSCRFPPSSGSTGEIYVGFAAAVQLKV